jgi:hypothetical protein
MAHTVSVESGDGWLSLFDAEGGTQQWFETHPRSVGTS